MDSVNSIIYAVMPPVTPAAPQKAGGRYNPDEDDYDVRTAPCLPAEKDEIDTICVKKQIAALRSRISKGGDPQVLSHYFKVIGELESSLSGSVQPATGTKVVWVSSGHKRNLSQLSTVTTGSTHVPDEEDLLSDLEDMIPDEMSMPVSQVKSGEPVRKTVYDYKLEESIMASRAESSCTRQPSCRTLLPPGAPVAMPPRFGQTVIRQRFQPITAAISPLVGKAVTVAPHAYVAPRSTAVVMPNAQYRPLVYGQSYASMPEWRL
eukprot:TRINITY_DN4951_c0_g1_i2.p1 TRINITY_DN4951_c0_g1~~TRINITY_DN4951_c0_g1_i2.p1  ORF type:complete len:263 (+),score=44.73 TRINITY_DN4951_c0_g1_i2:94-882(+)